jgi:predicted Zn-dependent protease
MSEYRQAMIPNYYPIVKKVQNVASRLINVSGLDHLDWQVHVIQSPIKNAFVIPGGKIFVFTGILEVADTPDKLAAVLGHEIAHVVARHSAEQLSFRAVVIMANTLVSIFMDPPRLLKNLLFQYGFLMPHSRVCETEADEIGLHLMSRACYDPRGAVEFWRSMDKQDKEILQFLSTHPKSETRIENLKKLIPKGDVIRHDSGCDLASSMFHQYQSFFK